MFHLNKRATAVMVCLALEAAVFGLLSWLSGQLKLHVEQLDGRLAQAYRLKYWIPLFLERVPFLGRLVVGRLCRQAPPPPAPLTEYVANIGDMLTSKDDGELT